jgi:hypothetical protein
VKSSPQKQLRGRVMLTLGLHCPALVRLRYLKVWLRGMTLARNNPPGSDAGEDGVVLVRHSGDHAVVVKGVAGLRSWRRSDKPEGRAVIGSVDDDDPDPIEAILSQVAGRGISESFCSVRVRALGCRSSETTVVSAVSRVLFRSDETNREEAFTIANPMARAWRLLP